MVATIWDWLDRITQKIGMDLEQRLSPESWSMFFQHIVDTAVVILFASVVIWIARRAIRQATAPIQIRSAAHRRKIETFASLVFSTVKYVVYIAAVLWTLRIWGVDTQTLVVGSAVIGGAIGFGSQGLVQDIITGLSILAEEQLAVGDFVEISGKSGAVEEVGLRVVKIRDQFGVQHVIFNRTIGMVSNFTMGSVQAVVDVSLQGLEQAEQARAVATRVCTDLVREVPFFPMPPNIEGVIQSSTQDIFLRIHVRVLPQQQAAIQDHLVDRIKRAFAAEKVTIPDNRVRVVVLSELFTRAIRKAYTEPYVKPAVEKPGEKLLDGAV